VRALFQLFLLALLTETVGCASQKIALVPAADQEAIVRNGVPALISRKKHLVMLRPNTRLLKGNARPAFTLVVRNQSTKPETLFESSITANQVVAGKSSIVRIYRYEELVSEEETRQAIAAFGTALSAAGRSMSAANAGYVNTTGSVSTYGPYGVQQGTYSATTYDPARAQIAQDIASAETRADVAQVQAQGQANLGALQATILKDNTVMPGEWYGGTIVLAPPERPDQGPTAYSITINFGGEEHTFAISQVPQ
jgi:hypothetical protein